MIIVSRRAVYLIMLSALLFLPTLLQAASASSVTSISAKNVSLTGRQSISPYLTLDQFQLRGLAGPYHTKGNLIVGADGQPYLFHGVARDDLEYLCTSDGHYTIAELGLMGLGNNSNQATYWGGNIVRLPLSENFWLYGSPSQNCSASEYQSLIKRVVITLTSLNLNVMLDLQWTNAGGQSTGAGDAWSMPDADSVTFWRQLASRYKSNNNVLFEIYNEPHLANGSWPCWRNGCKIVNDSAGSTGHDHSHYTYSAVGMQTLLDTIRQAGANNLVVAAGINWGFDLSQILSYHLNGTNVVYDTHPYPYGNKQPAFWDAAFGTVSATYPVISAESGEYDCRMDFIRQLFDYFDAHDIGWISWAWLPPFGDACGYPRLVVDLTGKPTAQMGIYIYQHLHTYLFLLANEELPARLK